MYLGNLFFRVKFNIIRSLTYFSVIITCFTCLLSMLTATWVQRFSLIIEYFKIKGKYFFHGRTIEFYNLLHKMGIPRGHVLDFQTELWTLRKIFLSFIYITFPVLRLDLIYFRSRNRKLLSFLVIKQGIDSQHSFDIKTKIMYFTFI